MIILGRVIAPYGVKGWLKVHTFGDDPEAWRQMPEWWLSGETGNADWRPWQVNGFRSQGAGWVAKLAGVDDRSIAETLVGRYIAAPREALPVNQEGEYYWADLIGAAVVNEQDDSLGVIDSLIETGGNQVLVVKSAADGIERLIPFIGTVIKQIDVAAKRVRVDWGKDW